MKIYRYQLNDLIRYLEFKEAGKDVLAGLLRQSASFDMDEALTAFERGELEVVKISQLEEDSIKK